MATIDYVALQKTARGLVNDLGRPVTFVQLTETPADPSEPWRGADTPRNPAATEVPGDAVAVPPSSASQLGFTNLDSDFVKRAEQIFIAVVDAGQPDIEEFDEVIDGATTWKINAVEKLQPATTTLLFFVSVRR